MNKEIYHILKQYWGYDSFRSIQEPIITSVLAGHDTLGLMPTGGGKSITFQVPALVLDGMCVVITPLIALMKDQVQNLRHRGIRAEAIYTGLSRNEISRILDNAVFGAVKILYVSPERLESELFITKLRHSKVSFITVDEAHCISQWGYDFRPSYLRISRIREAVGEKPILALTATATPEVAKDIQYHLQFREGSQLFQMSFERKNLSYVVRNTEDKPSEMLHILSRVPGSSIVYVRNRQHTEDIAKMLHSQGVSATFYHAGLENQEKDKRQKAWTDNEIRVMVATNAFGMGIDKPDVRTVIHIDSPDSLEAYFQEAGRAGRDGQKSYAILLCNEHDKAVLQKRIVDNYPEKDYIRDVYNKLCYYYEIAVGSGYNKLFEFDIERFCRIYRLFPIPVNSSLKILSHAGYIDYEEEAESFDRLHFLITRSNLYELDHRSQEEEKVITALLRCYGGLFSEYQFISLALIADEAGLTKPQVYQILRTLDSLHIVRFIPGRRIPHIRFIQRREDAEHLLFPREIYEDLRIRFRQRLEKMIEYAHRDDCCRSSLLLDYFGEKRSDECGQCDYCIRKKKAMTAEPNN